MTSGVPNLYNTKCKRCNADITNHLRFLVDLEPPTSSRKRYGFICADCKARDEQ